jgi:hypothetical protein
MDLYRASFRIGKEKQRRAAAYVLNQIRSVEELDHVFLELEKKSLGSYMRDVKNRMSEVEDKLATSGCF